MAWAQIVLDNARRTYLSSGDPLMALETAATTTDAVNKRILNGEESPSRFCCDDDMRALTTHLCGECGLSIRCERLVYDQIGYLACEEFITSRKGGKRRAAHIAQQGLAGVLASEAQILGKVRALDRDEGRALREDAEALLETGEGSEYVNSYSGKTTLCPTSKRHPEALSNDAKFPVARSDSGTIQYHAADNIAVVPLALNYMKKRALLICLKAISEYCRAVSALKPRRGNPEVAREIERFRGKLVDDFWRYTRNIRRMVVADKDPDAERKRALQREYAELLDLPLILEARNLLRFTFGHRHHRHQMWTGWPLKLLASTTDSPQRR
ncbi:uncharacterized protein DNG_06341 [Cephalotrichum gorgonifer]|uniref:Uncharacterized protein n=1 Tax=Cephalotrichum gorgonifer TaxID=2041049 RepID=A0AAE8SWF9_9PEZI|nr:uncharacterized protein DNG_06341 [Cephalotrichum gorgonifer]